MSKHTLICLLLLLGMGVGTVCGQDSDSIVGAEPVKIPIWDNGFRIGLTSQAQLVLPATLSADDPYVKSLPGFGGENGIEFSYSELSACSTSSPTSMTRPALTMTTRTFGSTTNFTITRWSTTCSSR